MKDYRLLIVECNTHGNGSNVWKQLWNEPRQLTEEEYDSLIWRIQNTYGLSLDQYYLSEEEYDNFFFDIEEEDVETDKYKCDNCNGDFYDCECGDFVNKEYEKLLFDFDFEQENTVYKIKTNVEQLQGDADLIEWLLNSYNYHLMLLEVKEVEEVEEVE